MFAAAPTHALSNAPWFVVLGCIPLIVIGIKFLLSTPEGKKVAEVAQQERTRQRKPWTFDRTGRWLLVISVVCLIATHMFAAAVIAFFLFILCFDRTRTY